VVKSNFSFLEGASHPAELVEQAAALSLPSMALTDRDGVYGMVEAHMAAKNLGVRLIIGAQVTLQTAVSTPRHVVLLATTRAGYGELCQLISKGRLRSQKGSSQVTLDEAQAHNTGLLALCPQPELLPKLHEIFNDRFMPCVLAIGWLTSSLTKNPYGTMHAM